MNRSVCIAICLVSLGNLGFGQSLGEIAKKEKARRKNNEGEARVIDDQALAEAGEARREEQGSEKSGDPESEEALLSGSGETGRSAKSFGAGSSEPSSPASRTDAERDVQKQAAIARLESLLSSMRGEASGLISAAQRYQQNCTGVNATNVCEDEIRQVARQAVVVGKMLDEANELARKSRITPGELRELREKHGLDSALWDATVRFAAKYGH
jgi:hypothetical protein